VRFLFLLSRSLIVVLVVAYLLIATRGCILRDAQFEIACYREGGMLFRTEWPRQPICLKGCVVVPIIR